MIMIHIPHNVKLYTRKGFISNSSNNSKSKKSLHSEPKKETSSEIDDILYHFS